MIDEMTLNSIKNLLSTYEGEKRYNHTLGVADTAYELGMIFMPEKAEKLKLAGLLHDITKSFTTEKQLSLCEEYNIDVDLQNFVPKLLHAKTGCEYAKRLFGEEIVDPEIYSAILFHTTGNDHMTLFEQLVYLADYIEPNRTFEDCIILRKYFFDEIEKATDFNEKREVLRKTMVKSFDLTIQNLISEGRKIDSDTIASRNSFIVESKNV